MLGFSLAEGEKPNPRDRPLLAISLPVAALGFDFQLNFSQRTSTYFFLRFHYGPCANVSLFSSVEEPDIPPLCQNGGTVKMHPPYPHNRKQFLLHPLQLVLC